MVLVVLLVELLLVELLLGNVTFLACCGWLWVLAGKGLAAGVAGWKGLAAGVGAAGWKGLVCWNGVADGRRG